MEFHFALENHAHAGVDGAPPRAGGGVYDTMMGCNIRNKGMLSIMLNII